MAPLHTYVTSDDYPVDAVTKGEEGTVAFRLAVGSDGRVEGCTVTASSGSAVLDAAACRVMAERARFEPAIDSRGKPTQDTVASSISWRIPEAGEPQPVSVPAALNVATELWFACTGGEAAKLTLTRLSPSEVAARAIEACLPLEERIAAEMTNAKMPGLTHPRVMPNLKADVTARITELLPKARTSLGLDAPMP